MQILERARDAEATRLWSQFFCKNTAGNSSILIPECWSNFFTVMLLSTVNFAWAREFLTSSAFKLFHDANAGVGSIEFNIPTKCPNNDITLCSSEIVEVNGLEGSGKNKDKSKMIEMEPSGSSATKSTPKRIGSKKGPPLSDQDVRRSERFKNKNNGFKSSTCTDRRCISCSPSPPILSTKLIQNLGVQFCKMDAEDLTEEALTRKKRRTAAIGKEKAAQSHQVALPKEGDMDSGSKDTSDDEKKFED